jgi:16S rRNA (cytidine1402-2'-O)-methyltransferase
MAGTLSIVATPIGHLEDITLRALRVLREAHLIVAEDTRRTGNLLAHFGISTPTLSFHTHNTRSRLPVILNHLRKGESVALVSDAGTPVLSDPGLELVQGCIQENIAVDPIPGASAALALAVVTGFPLNPWTIYGFPPIRPLDRRKWLIQINSIEHPILFFEAPHRIRRTLADLASVCGDRPIVVGRELTKLHQTFYRGTVLSVSHAEIEVRGEFTVMLGPSPPTKSAIKSPPEDAVILSEFGRITETERVDRRTAIRILADRHGLSARQVYSAVERAKQG